MKGLELSESFYNEYGKKMLEQEFGDYLGEIAVGLVGHGSECFGFDDEISRDHDFDAGFNIWIPERDDAVFGFRLFRAYSKLPKEYLGVSVKNKSVGGASFKGVKTIEEFYSFYIGGKTLPKTNAEWLSIPDFYLAEATNGKVFYDGLGEFTKIRDYLKNERPEDVRLKKLASSLFYMAQSGQYNYKRCMDHGERVAAAMALSEFVSSAAATVFLLNREYAPYYKWLYRSIKRLNELSEVGDMLENALASPYDSSEVTLLVESVSAKIIAHLVEMGYVANKGEYLEPYAYAVNDLIRDVNLRNSPVML